MKIIHLIFIALFIIAIQACKKDIGNYDYTETEVVEIDTAGIGSTYRVFRLSNLKITPKIKAPEGHALEYQWLLYGKATSNSETPSSKVIAEQADLDFTISEPVGEYVAELVVTDRSTGLKSNILFDVNVTANMEFGMMVLYQGDEGGDVDFIRTPALSSDITETTHMHNLYSLTMEQFIPGEARFIWSARMAYQITNWITVGSDRYIARFLGSDFTFIRDQYDLFRRTDQTINPQAYVFATSFQHVLINDGKLLVASTGFFENDIKFNGAADGDYELAPYLTPKVASSFYAVAYDQKNKKFIRYYVNNNSIGAFANSQSGSVFDLNSIGQDMLYMTYGVSNYTFAFFKDSVTNSRSMYVINFASSSDDGQLAIGAYDMTALPEIDEAKHYQVSGFGSYAYYATKQKIYNYAYGSSNTAKVAFEIPSGEEITCMRYYRPTPNSLVTDKEERVLYVSTWNGTVGKVYELKINETSGVIEQTPLNVFEIEGKVVDMSARAKGFG